MWFWLAGLWRLRSGYVWFGLVLAIFLFLRPMNMWTHPLSSQCLEDSILESSSSSNVLESRAFITWLIPNFAYRRVLKWRFLAPLPPDVWPWLVRSGICIFHQHQVILTGSPVWKNLISRILCHTSAAVQPLFFLWSAFPDIPQPIGFTALPYCFSVPSYFSLPTPVSFIFI